ncbi:hypothetical protein V6N13_113677 [Hibiscus sabdariffa]
MHYLKRYGLWFALHSKEYLSGKLASQGLTWGGDGWATRGDLIETDWSKAPFTVSYRNMPVQACIWSSVSGAYSSWLAKEPAGCPKPGKI